MDWLVTDFHCRRPILRNSCTQHFVLFIADAHSWSTSSVNIMTILPSNISYNKFPRLTVCATRLHCIFKFVSIGSYAVASSSWLIHCELCYVNPIQFIIFSVTQNFWCFSFSFLTRSFSPLTTPIQCETENMCTYSIQNDAILYM